MATPKKKHKAKKSTPKEAKFSDRSFWSTVKQYAKSIGESALTTAFTLKNAFHDESTPTWAKTVIGGALAYLILPIDAIPDVIPIVGFTDDIGALAAAGATVATYITDEHKREAEEQVENLFS
jgi:uncharacterized membrane protein YkvA (DUF1232 family)